MKRLLVGAMALALGAIPVAAQSLEDLNIQIHGYATQGFLYSSNNNILTTNSSNGSPDWSEAVVNLGSQPMPKLRVGVQARYFLLGLYSNTISIDWAQADYKFSEMLGVRFGKVKTPGSLFNETQDIDPSYIWCLMPQSVYPLGSRNALLAHYGGSVYGAFKLGPKLGMLGYKGWGGLRTLLSTDGYLLGDAEKGIVAPNGLSGSVFGVVLEWKPPLPGLKLGTGLQEQRPRTGSIVYTSSNGLVYTGAAVRGILSKAPDFYGQYERDRFMAAAEFTRKPILTTQTLTGGPPPLPTIKPSLTDQIDWYGMATYKLTNKLTAGAYDSQYFNHAAELGPARFTKDWAISTRYDFNQFLYAKVEQHFINGTALVYDKNLNLNGLKPTTKLTLLKAGVSF